MLKNQMKFYVNNDMTIKDIITDQAVLGSNSTIDLIVVAPLLATNIAQYGIILPNSVGTEYYPMEQKGTEVVDNETWNVWIVELKGSMLNIMAQRAAEAKLTFKFTEVISEFTGNAYTYIGGSYITVDQLNAFHPMGATNDYAGVGTTGNRKTDKAFTFNTTNKIWEDTTKTIGEFENDNGIIYKWQDKQTAFIPITFQASYIAGNEDMDITMTAVLQEKIAKLEARVTYVEVCCADNKKDIASLDARVSFLEATGKPTEPGDAKIKIQLTDGRTVEMGVRSINLPIGTDSYTFSTEEEQGYFNNKHKWFFEEYVNESNGSTSYRDGSVISRDWASNKAVIIVGTSYTIGRFDKDTNTGLWTFTKNATSKNMSLGLVLITNEIEGDVIDLIVGGALKISGDIVSVNGDLITDLDKNIPVAEKPSGEVAIPTWIDWLVRIHNAQQNEIESINQVATSNQSVINDVITPALGSLDTRVTTAESNIAQNTSNIVINDNAIIANTDKINQNTTDINDLKNKPSVTRTTIFEAGGITPAQGGSRDYTLSQSVRDFDIIEVWIAINGSGYSQVSVIHIANYPSPNGTETHNVLKANLTSGVPLWWYILKTTADTTINFSAKTDISQNLGITKVVGIKY